MGMDNTGLRATAWAWRAAQEEADALPLFDWRKQFSKTGSALSEARAFYDMYKRQVFDLQTLRRDIGLSERQREELQIIAAQFPRLRDGIERAIAERYKILALFDELVAEGGMWPHE